MTENNPGEDRIESFEELLAEAEELAGRMEDGGLSLDQALAAYEKGAGNLRRCAEILREAEAKVKLLTEKGGAFKLEDFPAAGSGGTDDGGDGGDAR
ncbi:MAG: exodeoxyribonuclease VII small subunit [Planctomycetota bacterium]|jgi:exodeoxyribonuclease VII small subunit|nr:exodeoxyribonuclease VII small subunit [Planctomycetota bacterium]